MKQPLSLLPRRIANVVGRPVVTKAEVYKAVVDGVIPASLEKGRWGWDDADLPAIIAALGAADKVGV